MESIIIIISGVLVGGFVMGTSGLVCLARYLTNKINQQNEEKMNDICNKVADRIEEDMKNNPTK